MTVSPSYCVSGELTPNSTPRSRNRGASGSLSSPRPFSPIPLRFSSSFSADCDKRPYNGTENDSQSQVPEVAIETSGAGTSWAEIVEHFTQLEAPEKTDGKEDTDSASVKKDAPITSLQMPSWQIVGREVTGMQEPASGSDEADSDVSGQHTVQQQRPLTCLLPMTGRGGRFRRGLPLAARSRD